jgi:hypothetical protein
MIPVWVVTCQWERVYDRQLPVPLWKWDLKIESVKLIEECYATSPGFLHESLDTEWDTYDCLVAAADDDWARAQARLHMQRHCPTQ